MYFTCIASVSGMYPRCIMTVISQWTFMDYGCIGSCAPSLCLPHNVYWRCIWSVYFSVLVMYWQCNTSQYIIKVLGCITRCIVMYSLMYQCIWWGIWVHEQEGDTSQYICLYITMHHRIHHNTSKIHPNTSVMYWDGYTSNMKKYLIHPEYIAIHPNTSSTSPAIC